MSVGWYFEEMDDKDVQNADLLTKHAFENDIDTFVRETLQNANDARRDGYDGAVEVYYRFTRLTGEDLVEFLTELDWKPSNSDETGLFTHLQAAGENEDDRQLDKFLNRIQESGELMLLSVEDRYTEGLPGSETEDETNYTALIRDMGRSNKGDTEGGSHGVGKTVLWAFSGLSTVLFTSTPEDVADGKVPPRFVGRTLLPDHRDETGQLYSGNGWYGAVDPDDLDGRYISCWDDDGTASERAKTLYTEQGADVGDGDDRVTGTTATVLGFRDPTEEIDPEADDIHDGLAERFERTVARYFWPALEHGVLNVYISGPEDTDYTEVVPEEVDEVAPFIQCFHNRFDPSERLSQRGDIVTADIEVEIPDKDSSADGPTETEDVGYVSVYARRPGPGDDETYLNDVAIFRGAGMVVDYIAMEKAAAYGSSFYGLLMAGEARGWGNTDGHTDADTQIDELLRTSEPAAHDEWKGYKNTKLQNKYDRGAKTTVQELTRSKLQNTLQGLVKCDDIEDDDEITALNKQSPRLNVGGGGTTRTSTPTVVSSDAFDVDLTFTYRDGKWIFEGSIGPTEDDFDDWGVDIEIRTIGEDNSDTGRLDIADVLPLEAGAVSNTDNGVGHIDCNTSLQSVNLRGESVDMGEFDPYSGRLGRTKLAIEGEVNYGGDD